MVVGGWGLTEGLSVRLRSSEGLGVWSPPEAPTVITDAPLVLVGTRVFMCGGGTGSTVADCYMLDTREAPTWKSVTQLQTAMSEHSGVAIGDHIWFVYMSAVYDYHTTSGISREYSVPFSYAWGHCAVSNGTHSYVIGVGSDHTEIWVNTIPSIPSKWKMVSRLPMTKRYMSCLWFEDEIYIPGGRDSSGHLNNAFAMDVKTHSIRPLGFLNQARAGARCMVIDCKPAIVGGWVKGKALSSIELYDEATDSWEVYKLSLQTARSSFGLVQFPS